MGNYTLEQFKNENLLSKKSEEGLKILIPKTLKAYITTKIYKYNNPGRPVVIPSYIKDTNDSVNKIDNFKVSENSFLVTMDVKALHTNIPNNEGIAAVKRKHGNYPNKIVATKGIFDTK